MANMLKTNDLVEQTNDFTAVQLRVASSDTILSWSHGEVLKPETINYRTQKPERDGLFCERIFGPTKDYECYCGKYKKIRYKGVVCDKCGVEVTKSFVRRVRMGHIDLAVPVAHIWYVQGIPSNLGLLLDMSVSDLEKIIYFAAYVILGVDEDVRAASLAQLDGEYKELKAQLLGDKTKADQLEGNDLLKLQQVDAQFKEAKSELEKLHRNQVISELAYHELSLRYGAIVRVGIGAEAIKDLLESIVLEDGIQELKIEARTASPINRRKVLRRLKLYTDLKVAAIKPEWLVLGRLPVIPPDLRPMVQLDGGRFAASDLNDLYRRVLNRNNRLKKLLNSGAPEVITRNEKRMLQEAVDALIDNSARRGKAAAASTGMKRKLKSLSDMLRGKQGRFRQNLLGKRVDYSGRSVIVVGPNLKLHQCGLPKMMALELFKPFVIGKLIAGGYVHNVKNATRLIESGESFVWDILEDITKDHFVLLNRAPTLHRLGIQAFQPVLIEGKSIQIHPLVCTAYNADFDGDQMAVHVPLSKQAQKEAQEIMLSSRNLLKPASGEVIVGPTKDMILGAYYMTVVVDGLKGEGKAFSSQEEAILAYNEKIIELRAKVKVSIKGELIETSVGQVLFNEIVPEELGYQVEAMDKKAIAKIIQRSFNELGTLRTAEFVDDLKNIGFKYAERSGVTFSLSDIVVPSTKGEFLARAEDKLAEVDKQYRRGLITSDEQYVKTVETWFDTTKELEKEVMRGFHDLNPIMTIFKSGARGAVTNINQIAGMKGLVGNPSGRIIEIPLKSNFKEGLSVFEYFISTHGSRKGRADTALRTADAGYLTRRLVDVAQDVVVAQDDCKAKKGIVLYRADQVTLGEAFETALIGRYTHGENLDIPAGTLITEEVGQKLAASSLEQVTVRSPLYCEAKWGICQKCYGNNLATGKLVEHGQAVGIIAAQAIGEPGTQLTMKTFHMGGVAQTGGDITSGLPRVEELFEARSPKTPAVVAEIEGKVVVDERPEETIVTITSKEPAKQVINLPAGFKVIVAAGDTAQVKDIVAQSEEFGSMRATVHGKVAIEEGVVTITAREKDERVYTLPASASVMVESGDTVLRGDPITEGHIELQQLLHLCGRAAVERYVVSEVQRIYFSQGQSINNKHIEIIVRQMLSKVQIADPGKSTYITGQTVDLPDIRHEADKMKIRSEQLLLGITRVSLWTKSFLSAASFQETTSVLINAAVMGKRDELRGLKENVIIGKLIPAGTGYDQSLKN
ncbi:MAG TPA: DNA-directed RNA polymerase subunit beta' [Verrucomicrobiae bacterium]|nr:DNA-directed RNA polymerase subunit beta' [Verrucomicrobiae bacterium]